MLIYILTYSLSLFWPRSGIFDCFKQPMKQETSFMDAMPGIECYEGEWWWLAGIGGFAVIVYVIGLPCYLIYILATNHILIKLGDMQCLARYGFLFKPYKGESNYWEVIVLLRKSLLVLVIKFQSQSPYMQGVYSIFIYAATLMMQARAQPYRQSRHTALANYLLSVNMLAVFSSLIFTAGIATEATQVNVLYLNLIMMIMGWSYAAGGIVTDLYLYLRLNLFVAFAEEHGSADPNLLHYYKCVDPHGVVNLVHYDMLVLRNRYFHTVKRRSAVSHKIVIENQTEANAHFNNYVHDFAVFLRRIDPDLALPNWRTTATAEKENSPLAVATEKVEEKDLKFMKESARMLRELFSDEMLSMMVLYQDYVIKHDLTEATRMTEYGKYFCHVVCVSAGCSRGSI